MPAKEFGKTLAYTRIVIAAIGLLTSAYLAIIATFNVPAACPNIGPISCETVLSSSYAKIFGAPNGYLGIAFFLIVLSLIYLNKPEYLALFNAVGIGFVIYFVYAEYRIGSICPYCTLVHACVLALLALSVYELRG